ncbi:saposin B domain-containing protein [Perilla frutescens var. hirtella]|uniref:Pulmonary surfactant-associated protein B n=1 Tax=Perilla frutescens var. hirtella TaxID=608512 RepID=A0AAD4IQB6_PERFH|nr:saposin B domain-containing protein [Perilla frutescens var. hirtella]
MDRRVLLVLIVLSSCWCCNARDLTVLQSNDKVSEGEAQHVQEVTKKENLCSLCEEFASEALNYLSLNKTQNEIISILHKSCSKIPSFKQQCIVLVDYYAPLFFLEVSSIDAEDFCQKVNLCEDGISMPVDLPKDKCELCHTVVSEALLKLKDPDTELEIVELLLKACNSIGKNVKKCKKLVFEYAPIILINAEQFLETNDLCNILHACDAEGVSLGTEASMHAAS